MRTFHLIVTTKSDFVSPLQFCERLEDLVPTIFNPQTEQPEDRQFRDVVVLDGTSRHRCLGDWDRYEGKK